MQTSINTVILGGGCFWCIEAAFQRLAGVTDVVSGYAGGSPDTANYRSVCSGTTGHAEVVLVQWDENKINLENILDCFFSVHDATTLNRQGNDVGTQYRSYIGYHDTAQLDIINRVISIRQSEVEKPIVTELSPNPKFYRGEENHQNYYNENTTQPYCQIVIKPKLDKISQ